MNITSVCQLKAAIIALLSLSGVIAWMVYLLDPALYTQSLDLTSSASMRYPFLSTLALGAISGIIAVAIIGVVRSWRWLFWLLLLAFGASILQFPVTALQLINILPLTDPLWYRLLQTGIAVGEFGIAVWMYRVYRSQGTWAERQKQTRHFDRV
jgi:hypothetical protein